MGQHEEHATGERGDDQCRPGRLLRLYHHLLPHRDLRATHQYGKYLHIPFIGTAGTLFGKTRNACLPGSLVAMPLCIFTAGLTGVFATSAAYNVYDTYSKSLIPPTDGMVRRKPITNLLFPQVWNPLVLFQ